MRRTGSSFLVALVIVLSASTGSGQTACPAGSTARFTVKNNCGADVPCAGTANTSPPEFPVQWPGP